MCLNRYPLRAAALVSLVFACSAALAQPTGLRLGPQFGLRENPVGLKLRFVDSRSPLFSVPADSFLAAPASTRTSLGFAKTYSSLIADWQLNTNGLRASAGLVLRYRATGIAGEETRRNDVLQGTPETYLGFGWTGEPFGSGSWQFSADVGSFVSTKSGCTGPRCTASSLGLRPDAGGSGIRWTPYVAIGAQLSY